MRETTKEECRIAILIASEEIELSAAPAIPKPLTVTRNFADRKDPQLRPRGHFVRSLTIALSYFDTLNTVETVRMPFTWRRVSSTRHVIAPSVFMFQTYDSLNLDAQPHGAQTKSKGISTWNS